MWPNILIIDCYIFFIHSSIHIQSVFLNLKVNFVAGKKLEWNVDSTFNNIIRIKKISSRLVT
jgi:hypothetical protein